MWGHVENDQDDYFDKDDCVHRIEHSEGKGASAGVIIYTGCVTARF